MDCNDAPVRLIASLPHEGPYSFMGEATVQHTNGYGSSVETYLPNEDDEDYSLHIAVQQLRCSHEYIKIPKEMKVKEMTAAMYPGETFSTRCPDCTGCRKCENIQVDRSHEENEIIRHSVE